MATITITIPDLMVTDFALYKGYVDDPGETEEQFVKRFIVEYARNAVRRQRMEVAGKAAERPILDQTFTEIV